MSQEDSSTETNTSPNVIRIKSSTLKGIFFVIFVLIAAFFMYTIIKPQDESITSSTVSMQGDTQIIEVTARGGYSPSLIAAKANTKTILRMKTLNTYDCSAAFRIPAIGYQKVLPSNGVTEIPIEPQAAGSKLAGTCSMGMYRLTINFN